MFEGLFRTLAALRRHTDAPFALERARYLDFCAQNGSTALTLASKCRELLWAARLLDVGAEPRLDSIDLHAMAVRRSLGQKGDPGRIQERFENIVRPWLRYLGWWKDRVDPVPWRDELESYCRWMRSERGLADSTISQWHGCAKRFLRWYAADGRSLADLAPADFDHYLAHLRGAGCSRLSTRNIVKGHSHATRDLRAPRRRSY
jgi:integrase/recombinase XerD